MSREDWFEVDSNDHDEKRTFGRGKTFAGAMETVAPDPEVYHPSHYTFGKYEVIDVLLDWFPDDPLLWQVGKYIARATRKGNELQDLEKARFYLDKRIELAREKSNTPK